VSNCSWGLGVSTDHLWFIPFTTVPGNTDVLSFYLSKYWENGIVTVSSAGNYAQEVSSFQFLDRVSPRKAGGASTPHIVVGNAMPDGTRNPTSQFLESVQPAKGILSIYNIGTSVQCALASGNDDWGVVPDGTSQATAITAGMIAYFLSDPTLVSQFKSNGGLASLPAAVKAFLINLGAQQRLNTFGDNIPRASLGDVMGPCTGGGPGPVPVPAFVVPGAATGLRVTTAPVTSGTSVVFPLNQLVCLLYIIWVKGYF
jgi:hypothetical protein